MLVPPPEPGTASLRDLHVLDEIGILRRAVRECGPLTECELAATVAAHYWREGVFESALTVAIVDGRLELRPDGRLGIP